jgi:hypothetical protein
LSSDLFLVSVTKDPSVVLHILGLLKDIVGDFPEEQLKATVEAIFDCMQVADPLVRTVGLKTVNGLFIARPDPSRLSAEVNAMIINVSFWLFFYFLLISSGFMTV